ncbi:MAG: DNA oxidative demethylase AlkB [Hyphomicrobium sp.]
MKRSPQTIDFFAAVAGSPSRVELAAGAVLLRGYALPAVGQTIAALDVLLAKAPFRRMVTPGGFTMSVAMSNCGTAGWITDRKGYRYSPDDPETGRPWPVMPKPFSTLARAAAAAGGFDGFAPDACLINRYEPGARMSLHQDKDERDFSQPIVSVSLGLPARFLFGGMKRSEKPKRVTLEHGDVIVWGGVSRLAFHGIDPLKDGEHPLLGRRRINLTFRKAL